MDDVCKLTFTQTNATYNSLFASKTNMRNKRMYMCIVYIRNLIQEKRSITLLHCYIARDCEFRYYKDMKVLMVLCVSVKPFITLPDSRSNKQCRSPTRIYYKDMKVLMVLCVSVKPFITLPDSRSNKPKQCRSPTRISLSSFYRKSELLYTTSPQIFTNKTQT